MIRPVLLLAAAFALSPAQADTRVTSRLYRAGEIVSVHGRIGLQSTIAFAEDERIENVAVGDSNAWQVVPNKRADLVFVRPLKAAARTNMTVVTDRHTYLFDLVSAAAEPMYLLSFTYPAPPPPPPMTPAQKAAAESPPPQPVVTPAPLAPSPADLNFAWDKKGARQLFPERTYDDGQATFLSWAPEVPLPAILTRSPTGVEGPVNYTVRGNTLVVDGVPAEIILRSGKQVATLTPSVPHPAVARPSRARVRPSLPMSSSVPTPIRLPQETASTTP